MGCDQEAAAGVCLLPADSPGAAEPVAVIADIMAFEAGDGRDDELVSARLFELLELGGQARFLGRRNDVRLIDDASGQLGKALRGGGGGEQRHSRSEERRVGKEWGSTGSTRWG